MNDAQKHRGPDGEGYYLDRRQPLLLRDVRPTDDETGTCGLAHRRLAILDPARGQQPMVSPDGRYVVMLNGEIYNFQSLRRELEATFSFKTDCDTEVLLYLHAREPDHPENWIKRLNGIFSFVVWDRENNQLLLARDHFGVKPLHFVQQGGCFLFASEIKSLLAAGIAPKMNRAALHVFMNVRYVPDQQTLFDGVHRFPPGHFAWVKNGRMDAPVRYYSLPEAGRVFDGTRQDMCRQIKTSYYRAVREQLLSDVPVGISLSGGLDSSMNVAAAQQAFESDPNIRSGDHRLRTFTIGFNEPTDELADAQIVADRFHTQHTAETLSLNVLGGMAEVIKAVEEPKINILQGYMLAGVARKQVKVLLSGLGGDELFAGYDIHRFCNTLGSYHRFTPSWLHAGLLNPVGKIWWKLQHASGALRFEHYRIGGQIALSLGNRSQFYARLRNAWDYDEAMYRRVYQDASGFRDLPSTDSYFARYFNGHENYLEEVLRAEFQTKMVNDFLINEDRVTSAHGVEGRVPFLDREFVELCMSIPAKEKMAGADTKSLWKDSVGDVLPGQILNKKKQGFTFSSYHQWTKDLRSVVASELTPEWCEQTGLFNYRFVKDVLDYPPHAHLRWHYFMVWMMLGVKKWMEVFSVSAR